MGLNFEGEANIMVFTDLGIQEFQKFIRGESTQRPIYLYFGSDNNPLASSEEVATLASEFIRKEMAWSRSGDNSLWQCTLLTTEAVGTEVNRYGMTTGSALGSGLLYTHNSSIIGGKTAGFSVQLQGEVIIKRA